MATETRTENDRSPFKRAYIEISEGDHPILRLFLRSMGMVLLVAIPTFLLSWFLPDGGPLVVTLLSSALIVLLFVIILGFSLVGISLALVKGFKAIQATISDLRSR